MKPLVTRNSRRERNWGFEVVYFLAPVLLIVGTVLIGVALWRNEFWVIERPKVRMWLGLKEMCYSWRGSYNCEARVFHDYRADTCEVAASTGERRVVAIWSIAVAGGVVAASTAIAQLFFKAHRSGEVSPKVLFGTALLSLILVAIAVGLYYHLELSLLYCGEYCQLSASTCKSSAGMSLRLAVSAGVLLFVAMVMNGVKLFDRFPDADERARRHSSPVCAHEPMPTESAPSPFSDFETPAKWSLKTTSRRTYEPFEWDSEESPPCESVVQFGKASEEESAAPYEDEIPKEKKKRKKKKRKDKSVPTEEEGTWYAAEEDDITSAMTFDEETGLYWSDVHQMYYDVESGHFYDSNSGFWWDPETDAWYQVGDDQQQQRDTDDVAESAVQV